jgi:hypothetical protein
MAALLGYGREVWCFGGLRTGRYATGAMLVAQAVYRRLTTPRGTLQGGDDEGAYGLDLSAYVGDLGPAAAARMLPGLVRAEVLKDDRIVDALVTVTDADNGDSTHALTISIQAALASSGEAFQLTLSASDTTTTLLGIA